MKIIHGNISPLAFYDELRYQNHRKSYAYGSINPLITYRNMLIPFQVVLGVAYTSIEQVLLVDINREDDATDITDSMISNGLEIKQYDSYNILRYKAILPISELRYEGRYYLRMTISGEDIYSEVFTIDNNVDNCLLLQYSNDFSFQLTHGMIDFSDGFVFRCYLRTEIGKPEYSFEEEATERMGYSFIESQFSKKTYKFTFLAPEYLCDAMRIVRMCNDKKITALQQEYELTSFAMEPNWEDQGDVASVECEFDTDTIVASVAGYASVPLGGDYNNDHNNDYLTD